MAEPAGEANAAKPAMAAVEEPVLAAAEEPAMATVKEPSLEERQDTDIGIERLVFFSDAVFAIAMTLLVIDLRVPDLVGSVTNQALATALADDLPRVFSYALSFSVIGMYWLSHWRRYAVVRRADETLVLLNLLLLGLVAAIPFPTSLLGQYGDLAVAVILYAGLLAAAGLAGTAGWWYVNHAGLVRHRVSSTEVRIGMLRGLAVPIVMLGSLLLLPFLGPGPVELTWLLIIPMHWLIARWARRA